MAKTSYLGANIGATDSFSGWIDKTNAVRDDMGNIVVTVTQVAGEPNTVNSGLTSGNLAIVGVVTANTIAVATALRGGTVTTPADLAITSNTILSTTGNVDITAANTVNINSNNTIMTSNLTFNATSKFIRIDANTITVNTGAVTIASNTTLSGAFVTITGNTTIGDSASVDRLTVTAALAADLIPTTNVVNLGSSANNYGNVFSTFVYSANNIQTSNQFVLNGAGVRTIRAIDSTVGASPPTFNFVVANSTVSTTALVANTTGLFASANVTYDIGSAITSWKSLFVKDATITSNTVTANLTVTNTTAGRVTYAGTGGLVVDSANLTFSGTLLNVIGSANVTVNANVGGTLGVVGAITASNTLNVTGLTTMSTANVTSNANVAGTLGVVGAITASNTLNVTGLTTMSTANVTSNANVAGTLGVVGNTTLSANLAIAANKYINIGTGPELQLYSNGTNSYITEGGTGTLSIDSSQLNIVTSNTTATETMATFVRSGAATLYFANTKTFETVSGGVTVTGTANVTTNATVGGTLGVTGLTTMSNTNITATANVGGTLNVVGASTLANTQVTNLVVTGNTTLSTSVTLAVNTSTITTATILSTLNSNGNTIIGDSTSDVVQFIAYANSSLIPSANNTYPLGAINNYWSNVYSNNITSITTTGNVVNGNTINSNTVFANTAVSYLYHVEQSQTATLTTVTQAPIATFAIASFSAAEILVCATQGTARHISKILLTHDGTTAYATEYGTILTGSSLVTYNVDVSGGNVRFLATLGSATSTVFNTALTLIKI